MELDFSRPGKPTDNAFIEAFNGRFRQECLNENWFLSLADAEEKVETWRNHYNREAPQYAGKPVPTGVRRASGNSGLTRKTRTIFGTGNGARSVVHNPSIDSGSDFGARVISDLDFWPRDGHHGSRRRQLHLPRRRAHLHHMLRLIGSSGRQANWESFSRKQIPCNQLRGQAILYVAPLGMGVNECESGLWAPCKWKPAV